MDYPLGIEVLMGKSFVNGPFSIATFNTQRVMMFPSL
jgi:hypothetical protein